MRLAGMVRFSEIEPLWAEAMSEHERETTGGIPLGAAM